MVELQEDLIGETKRTPPCAKWYNGDDAPRCPTFSLSALASH